MLERRKRIMVNKLAVMGIIGIIIVSVLVSVYTYNIMKKEEKLREECLEGWLDKSKEDNYISMSIMTGGLAFFALFVFIVYIFSKKKRS